MPQVTEAEKNPYGYWIDLSSVKLDDSVDTSWIQAFPVGTWDHPVYGTIEMTHERANMFAQNVNARVREQDLDIDYDHKDFGGKAAGWVKSAQARADGLWILVEWTPPAKDALKNKEYRYFSPEYVDEWKRDRDGTVFQDVLFGGAITNRPFLKDILPINLSEVMKNNAGGDMDETMKAFATALGLDPETATPEDLVSKVTELNKVSNPPKKEEPKPETVPAQLSEEAVIKLLNEHPVVKALQDKVNSLESSNRLSEITLQVRTLSEGKPHRVPPVVEEALVKALVGLPKDKGDAVVKMFSDLLTQGLVPLQEIGGTNKWTGEGMSASRKFSELVAEKQKADTKLSYPDAASQVGRENPGLWEAYRLEALDKG